MAADAYPLRTDPSAPHLSADRSLPKIFSSVVAEISQSAGPESAAAFLSALGDRIAAQSDVGDAQELDALVDRINEVWAPLGWGRVTMELHDEGVDILHHAGPPSGDREFDRVWEQALPALLIGAYGRWFKGLAGAEQLRMRLLRRSRDVVELRYGL